MKVAKHENVNMTPQNPASSLSLTCLDLCTVMKHLALTFSSLCIVASLNSLRLSNWSRMIVAQSIACLYMLTSSISSVTQKLTDKYVIRFAIWSVIEQIGIRNADCQRKAPSMNFLPRSSLSTCQTKRSPYAQLGGYWTMHASYSCHLKDLFGMFTPAITSHRRTWHLELNIKHIKKIFDSILQDIMLQGKWIRTIHKRLR